MEKKVKDFEKKTADLNKMQDELKTKQEDLKSKLDHSEVVEKELVTIKATLQTVVVFNRLVHTCQVNMLQSIRTMGAMLFAHRKHFKGILKLRGIELKHKKDVWQLIPEYAERFQQHLNSSRQNQVRLKYYYKWTNYALNGTFHEQAKRTNKIKKQNQMVANFEKMIKARYSLAMEFTRFKISNMKKNEAYQNLATKYMNIMDNKVAEECRHPFGKFQYKNEMAHKLIKFIEHIDKAGVLSLCRPIAVQVFNKDRKKIKKKQREKLKVIIPRTSFTFKLQQMESMRLIRRNGLKVSNYDKMAIRVNKISINRKREAFEVIHQMLLDFELMKRKMELYEKLEVNLIYVKTIHKRKYLRRLRYWHMEKTFLHRGFHALDQMLERRKSETFVYIQKQYYYAPEKFWEWQNKGGFFKNLFRKKVISK